MDTQDLRTATTLHHTLVLWHIPAVPLFFILIPIPMFLEGIQIQLHNVRQDLSIMFLLHAVDEFV